MNFELTKANIGIIVIIIITSILTIVWSSANATSINLPLEPITGSINGKYLNQVITIEIQKSCIISKTCPSYDFLLKQKLDTSKIQSGKFSNKTGIYLRETTQISNEIYLYSFEPYQIILNPSYSLAVHSKLIRIVPSLDNYILDDGLNKINNTRILHTLRYTDTQCTESIISGKDWLKTLADTISFMRNNCNQKFTLIDDTKIIIDNQTQLDYTTSQKYKEDLWKEQIKKSYNENKIGNDNSTNKSVTEDKDPKYVPPITPPFDYSKYR